MSIDGAGGSPRAFDPKESDRQGDPRIIRARIPQLFAATQSPIGKHDRRAGESALPFDRGSNPPPDSNHKPMQGNRLHHAGAVREGRSHTARAPHRDAESLTAVAAVTQGTPDFAAPTVAK